MKTKSINIGNDIIQQAKAGDMKAFEQIVLFFEKPLLNFILRMTYKMEDAEDLTQETFIKIYKNLDKYDEKYKFSTWVFTVAKNTVYDWMRKRKNHELYIIDDEEKPFESFYPDKKAEDINRFKNKKIDLENALNKIKPIYRSVLTLFYIQGFNYKEISQIHKIPLNTVKTYIYRAKLVLRNQLN